MATTHFSNPAPKAQKSTQVIQSSRFCASCQLQIHCGSCTCCQGHHLSNTRIILSTGAMVRVPQDADPDSYRRYAESRIKLAANPKKKTTKRTYRPRQSSRKGRVVFPFDAGMQATAERLALRQAQDAAAIADEDTFVSGLEWDDDAPIINGWLIPFSGEPVVYESEADDYAPSPVW